MIPLQKLRESQGSSNAMASEVIVPRLVSIFKPRTVTDFGCGSGTWVKAFRKLGVNAIGMDRFPPDLSDCHHIDLNRDKPCMPSDMALCLEVVEHLKPSSAEAVVETLTMSTVVVFAAGIPMQGGWGHINERWPDYWADLFAKHGYSCSEDLRWEFWDDERIPSWYRQDLLVFATSETLAKYHLRASKPRRVVHPDSWLHIGPMGIYQRLRSANPLMPLGVIGLMAVVIIYLSAALLILSQS